jgi:hypothetical protein
MSIERVHFREQQILTYSDLRSEQTYLVAMRRRHNIAHHGWGIVHGLELELAGAGVLLQPGFAVDGYGRELVVPAPVFLSAAALERLLSDWRKQEGKAVDGDYLEVIDVWLAYRLLNDFAENSRAREEAWLKLVHVDSGEPNVDPRNPPWVPALDWAFGPHREPQDDPQQEWPVYLGRVQCDKTEQSMTLTLLELVERPYAGLLGWQIVAPWRDQWLQMGNEYSGDNRRFAVSLPDTATGNSTDRWVIDNNSDTTLRGMLHLAPLPGTNFGRGNLRLLSAAVNQTEPSGIAFAPLDAPPAQAASWQIYAIATSQPQNLHAQLRFEIANPGQKQGDPACYEWVIGNQEQLFRIDDITDVPSLVAKLQSDSNPSTAPVSLFVWGKFDQATRVLLADPNSTLPQRQSALVQGLNQILRGDESIYEPTRFAGVVLRPETQSLIAQNPTGERLIRLNRLLLEDAYPLEIARYLFSPLLSVRADGTVIINGDLTIKGQLIEGPIQVDIDDERFQDELLKRWTGGLTRAGGAVDVSYKLELKIEITALSPVQSGQSFTYTVQITNTSSPIGIYNSLIITTLSAEFSDQTSPVNLPLPLSPLEPGNSYKVSADHTPSQQGTLKLTVTVTAASVTRDTVKQQESKEIQVN